MTSLCRSLIIAVSVLCASASGVTASAPGGSCDSARTTMELNRCSQEEYEARDRLLNQTYQEVLRQLNTDYQQPTREKLIKAQRLWVQFRDADCAAQESLYDGGTVHTVVYLQCLRDLTSQRIKDLAPPKWQGG
jgi:uncharacterized protein YecT (DUF1311 family)